MGQYKPMPKMETTEPSVELKLKKGGKVKKMQMGGAAPMIAPDAAPAMPMRRPMPMRRRAPPAMPMRRPMPAVAEGAPAPVMMRKEGGRADMAQDKAMIKKAIKQHDMQEHKGGKGTKLTLRKGGAPKAGPDVMGGLAGGLQATRANPKKTTGGVPNSNAGGYKNGGAAKFLANMSGGQNPKQLSKKTGVVKNGKPAGYKNGGAAKFLANMSGGQNPRQLPKRSGSVKNGRPAGYKAGGDVEGFTRTKKMCAGGY